VLSFVLNSALSHAQISALSHVLGIVLSFVRVRLRRRRVHDSAQVADDAAAWAVIWWIVCALAGHVLPIGPSGYAHARTFARLVAEKQAGLYRSAPGGGGGATPPQRFTLQRLATSCICFHVKQFSVQLPKRHLVIVRLGPGARRID
jgi:hypothetical protein